MRVAHLLRKYNPSEWGGIESAVLQLTTDLEKHGVGSVIYAPRLEMGTNSADPLEATNCVVRRFRARVPVWGISAERKDRLIAVGGNLISFDLMGSLWRDAGV